MFTLQEIKTIAEQPDMTDQEAAMLRDAAQGFAEVICQLMRSSTNTSNNRPVVAMSQNSPAAVEDELGKSPRECSA